MEHRYTKVRDFIAERLLEHGPAVLHLKNVPSKDAVTIAQTLVGIEVVVVDNGTTSPVREDTPAHFVSTCLPYYRNLSYLLATRSKDIVVTAEDHGTAVASDTATALFVEVRPLRLIRAADHHLVLLTRGRLVPTLKLEGD